jgi:hypothetical protein
MSLSRTLLLLSSLLATTAACGGNPASDDVAPDAADGAPCHVVFLDFDGVTIGPASAILLGKDKHPLDHDMAFKNASVLVTKDTAFAAFRDGAPDRAAVIKAIAEQVQATLEPYGVTVVTERPAKLDEYRMVVFGGAASQIDPAHPERLMAAPLTCFAEPEAIGFVFDVDGSTATTYANAAIQVIGRSAQVPFDEVSGDCMCIGDGCDDTKACTIGGAGLQQSPDDQACPVADTFDEDASFRMGFRTCE